ncbi:uncharacterized protein BDW43DRAFT_237565 [Aspergillus alliaceus]|uniref:uncharacterized protein n=1 Tax=Petromyces alliaceus TaxID=209559 RepID=UPI0012A73C68|nr:uncharacterized protein BDW43DRAFT_237565 [Aspergillus alliaceus]KAB8227740.1 hypothetical protein BDW43DRAFT_237565 [Aspergillus alliaceus]
MEPWEGDAFSLQNLTSSPTLTLYCSYSVNLPRTLNRDDFFFFSFFFSSCPFPPPVTFLLFDAGRRALFLLFYSLVFLFLLTTGDFGIYSLFCFLVLPLISTLFPTKLFFSLIPFSLPVPLRPRDFP